MRVALIDASDPRVAGSMRAYAETLLEALRQHARDIEVERIEVAPSSAAGRWRKRLATLEMLRRTRRAARAGRSRFDLWHVLDGSRAYLASGLGGAPTVITCHDVIPVLQSQGRFSAAPPVSRFARWLWRINASSTCGATAVMCDSESTRRDVSTALGRGEDSSVVVQLPLRAGLQALASDRKGKAERTEASRVGGRILHIGNSGFYKNRAQVLKIFAALPAALASDLVMVGPPPGDDLQHLAQEVGIAGRVRWISEADDPQLAALYRSARLFLFPSLYEGYGWPPLEAMSFGVPVLASNGGSLPEVIGDAAPCFDPCATKDYVAEAIRLLADPEAWQRARHRALSRAAQFTAERFAAQVHAVYARALEGTP